ncbi:MAG: hypothetical protein GVY15_13265 [Bacteroidetes bacterium]|jgi:hypothetical protein|nr:hypothetical protein [Bacteroidota bacterium]
MHTITLIRAKTGYLAKYSDPTVARLLGTDTLPTAFGLSARPEDVRQTIASLNPRYRVLMAEPAPSPTLPSAP